MQKSIVHLKTYYNTKSFDTIDVHTLLKINTKKLNPCS